ncbi:hypothetical protein GF382_03865 [Candidatus Falkowbacteria bacterium]|nr:hypothetical protein [Candidatus Falkowbacteria bacterium]
MIKNIQKKAILSLLFFFIMAGCLIAPSAQAYDFIKDSGLGKTASYTGHSELNNDSAANPVILVIMPLVGIAYLILMVYAGYLWMGAQGNEQQVTKAKNIIITATIGLLIILSSYAISIYVVSRFQEGYVGSTPTMPDG